MIETADFHFFLSYLENWPDLTDALTAEAIVQNHFFSIWSDEKTKALWCNLHSAVVAH